ncbi:MAG: NUDIX domain-containing protein [Cellulomonas sp.]|nr:NUDIX domain-containing protein [Cellulomonas sp.]
MTIFRGDEVDLRLAAYAVVTGERGLLLAHWTDRRHDHWTLPGGGMEPGEHPEQTLLREVEEETGYQAEVDGLLRVHNRVVPGGQRLDEEPRTFQQISFVYRARIVGGELRPEPDGSTDAAAWFAHDEIDALSRIDLVDLARRDAGILSS